ncbi:MAG: hypothetical protein GTO55_06945 [Armatimonadetes bacterium]|nr:hypothetical protein [Armatimonadota bacterium]NIM24011.1 hypothetical protein [Armatimonadota bacterium]NIM67861.1 hypothetical protein [Armatimonadota bacterium]NIM76392.1 hypothetical protein [Armatimonadota bacterium]NIN06091.1 hypothetical protein [Armatimonadota bacterium]
MSKKIGLLVAVAILAAVAAPAFAQGAFEDVPMDHWAYQAVDMLTQAGLVEGYPDGEFKGDRPMTRYEFAMIIARALQSGALAGPPGPPGPPGTPGEAGRPTAIPLARGLTPEQEALLAKLQKEFMPELKRLRSNVDELERRVSALEGMPTAKAAKLSVSGGVSVRTGLSGTELEFGANDSTGYPYPGIGGPLGYEELWFDPVEWGGINIPILVGAAWDSSAGQSIPISDAVKDAFAAPDFMTMRTEVAFDANLGSGVTARAVLLADPRGNLVAPYAEVDDWNLGSEQILSNQTPNIYYSDGIMDSVRVDEAWLRYETRLIRPIVITAGKQYWGFGTGLLANNSQQATKALRVDIALTGDAMGDGICWSSVLGALDREAFGGLTAGLPRWPDPVTTTENGGMDNYAVHSLSIPFSDDWTLGGNLVDTGFGAERGWSADVKGKLFGLDLWAEWAELTNFADGSEVTAATTPVKLGKEDNALLVGLGYDSDDLAIVGQYGEIEPLFALTDVGKGWDPVGMGAVLTAGGSSATNGYLNLPLTLMHPVEEFNPHYINWVDRPLFLDATNVAKGYEVGVTLKRILGERSPVSIRYYDGEAYTEDYLGWLFTDGASANKPSEWRDADPVWAVTLTHHFTDCLTANLTYGQREVDNIMSPNNPDFGATTNDDDPIKVLRLDLSVAF